jgi:membrane-associated phospholipid phosphatase
MDKTVESARSSTSAIARYLAATVSCVVIAVPFMMRWDEFWLQNRQAWSLPGDIEKVVNLSEIFAHGSGVFFIFFTLWWVDPGQRKSISRAALFTLAAGLIANGLKLIFTRVRPHADTNVSAADNWLPLFHGSFWDATHRSFPSGHAATAVAFAIGLSWVYPRGKYLFMGFAVMACWQRIASGAHFPSDVLAGAAIAFGCAVTFRRFVIRAA